MVFAPLNQNAFTRVMPPTENTPPKAFVSYSWTTGEYEQVVDELVHSLSGSGVELVYDKWDLHPGQDKYEYMERSVHDPAIGWVLILCDRGYAEKANDRRGGVGHETLILSPELYEDVRQRRAIPVIMERDEAGQPYLPAYLKGRIFVDLSNPATFHAEYEKLVLLLHGRPAHQRPPLGPAPSYVTEERAQSSPLRHAVAAYRDAVQRSRPTADGLLRDVMDRLVDAFRVERLPDPDGKRLSMDALREQIQSSIERFKPRRDEAVEFLLFTTRYAHSESVIDRLREALGRMVAMRFDRHRGVPSGYDDNLAFLLRELLLYTVAVLLKEDRLELATRLLAEPFFVPGELGGIGREFEVFDAYVDVLENDPARTLKSADAELLRQRATHEAVSFTQLMEADLVLAVRSVLRGDGTWHPKSLLYAQDRMHPLETFARAGIPSIGARLAPIFGADSMEAVKAAVQRRGDEALPSVAGFRGTSGRVLQLMGLAPPGLYR